MSRDEGRFVLDLPSNPHPRMLGEALLARRSAFDSTQAMAYWLGYRAAMCGATGCPADEIDAWLDHHDVTPVAIRGGA